MSDKVLVVGGYHDPYFKKASKALAEMTMITVAATGRDLVGDLIDSIGSGKKAKEPDEQKQGAAEIKRLRKAERNKRNASK